MAPVTQALFLYLLYFGNEKTIKKDASDFLGVAKMSITRASEQLRNMGLIKEEYIGKEIVMHPVAKGKDLYEMSRPYLINPVQRELYILRDQIPDPCIDAGETALANVSLLKAPDIREVAVYKADIKVPFVEEIDIKWDERKTVKLQLWKYDPLLFARDGKLDPVSLAMSLDKVVDERVEGELKEYLEEYKW